MSRIKKNDEPVDVDVNHDGVIESDEPGTIVVDAYTADVYPETVEVVLPYPKVL